GLTGSNNRMSRRGKFAGKSRRDKIRKRQNPRGSHDLEDITMELTRRHALAAGAVSAATPLLPTTPAKAAAPVADKQAPSFYRYKVGDIQVTVVSDGKNVFKLEDSFIANAKKDEVNAALEKAFLPRDMFTIYFAPLVINTGGKLVVLDTGNGALAKANSKGANGLFADNFVAAGFVPKAAAMGGIS